jgi:hypothetical protein
MQCDQKVGRLSRWIQQTLPYTVTNAVTAGELIDPELVESRSMSEMEMLRQPCFRLRF